MKRNLFLSFPKAARLLLATLICLPFWGTALMAQTAQPEAYAVFDSSTGTLTFKYDNSKPSDAYLMNTGTAFPGWMGNKEDIKKVVFDPSFAGARPTTCYCWFEGCQNLTDIEGISNLNTEDVTDMGWMFSNCEKLASLDISSFNTKNVENMSAMFQSCSSLTSIDLSHFNTENVTEMKAMFGGFEKLVSLDLSSFNTKNVTDMRWMFSGSTSLTSIDISSFNTENVEYMTGMFIGCSSLSILNLSSFNTAKVIDMGLMFGDCTLLTTIYASDKFVTANVEDGDKMFNNCTYLYGGIPFDENKTNSDYANANGYFTIFDGTYIYAAFDSANGVLTFKCDRDRPDDAYSLNYGNKLGPGWYRQINKDIRKVVFDPSFAKVKPISCYRWFCGCENLTEIEGIENLNTENVTDMASMFVDCSSLTSLDVSRFNTENVTDMKTMFSNCSSLTSLDISSFNTENVTDMSWMFDSCEKLASLDLSHFNTKNVEYMIAMFQNCSSLTSLDLSHFDTEKVTYMSALFSGCKNLTSLDLSNFNTENVTDMSAMFAGFEKITSLDLSSFNTKNVTNMSYMFSGSSSLASLDLSSFNTKNATDISFMFTGCHALTTIYASDKFVVTNVESDNNMFAECLKLKGAIEYDENKTNSSYANYTTGYFTLKTPTSINAINGNDKAEYFDINGKRDTKLQRGINLVRRGNKTYKVVVK